MLVSDRKKFIFVHNPKAAGSSVRSALAQYDDRNNAYWDHDDNARLGRVLDKAHITLDDFLVYPDASLIEEYFLFGFVRNPYTRLVSAFHERNKQLGISGDTDINHFIQTELNEITIRFDWKYIHFCPQYFFFYQGGKCKVDYIGRFEILGRDYARAANLANIDADTDLPHLNKMPTDEHDPGAAEEEIARCLEQFDPTSLSILNRLYDRDFVYFGYQKCIGDAADKDPTANNPRIKWVYQQTRYVKGEEAYYAARIDKLLEQTRQLQEEVDSNQALWDELQLAKDELQTSRDQWQLSRAELENVSAELRATRSELQTVLQENEGFRNSRSWRLTEPLRRLRNRR
jgi:sulfotransferase famil protein